MGGGRKNQIQCRKCKRACKFMHFWLPQILHSSTNFHTITEHTRTCLTPDSALHNLYLSETLRIAPWGHKSTTGTRFSMLQTLHGSLPLGSFMQMIRKLF